MAGGRTLKRSEDLAMGCGRRTFLRSGAAGLATLLAPRSAAATTPALLKPPRLKPGDMVGLINPVSMPLSRADAGTVSEALRSIGLRVTCGAHLDGSVSDERRAREMNALFADEAVNALLPVRAEPQPPRTGSSAFTASTTTSSAEIPRC